MQHKAFALTVLFSITGAPFACAHDGVINFGGDFFDQTCTIAVNGVVTPAVATVTLPTVSVATLATVGTTAGSTRFEITLSQCNPSSGTVAAYFEGGGSVDSQSGNLMNVSGTALNVQLQLRDAFTNAVIVPGNIDQRATTTHVALDSNASATLPYLVQYIAAYGPAIPGTVVSSVTYSIHYQ